MQLLRCSSLWSTGRKCNTENSQFIILMAKQMHFKKNLMKQTADIRRCNMEISNHFGRHCRLYQPFFSHRIYFQEKITILKILNPSAACKCTNNILIMQQG
jgi:hypothetical protein